MTPMFKKLSILFLVSTFFLSGCLKSKVEPSLEGRWIEVNPISKYPTGCEMTISEEDREVWVCGSLFNPSLTARSRGRLIVEDGQMRIQKRIYPVSIQRNFYFMDYEFEGEYLWIIEDDSDEKKTAKDRGRIFKKK